MADDNTASSKNELIARVMKAQGELQHLFASDRSNPLLNSNLTMSQLKILITLQLKGASGGQELARAMGVSLATMTGIVDRLVAQGLVSRGEDPQDRRVRLVDLSATGRQLVNEMLTAGAEHQRRLLERIDLDGLRIIEQGTRLIVEAFAAELAETGEAQAGETQAGEAQASEAQAGEAQSGEAESRESGDGPTGCGSTYSMPR